ncbi:GNAT family N-acetyltransferase [Natrarchaeobius oligotrophus]|uniref:N-acetyltransferase n=1 Tax=Natrarchaeobius chitinivorans TaxID=1679083 RepID=A0A3N6ML37_NATCH|nr:GNAT family N-acetyltransferase [Natrarchaeobius chitinivorans]RQG95026.1 N-acetyltransferase [Natrarchaeobius chitinivorans]
MTRAVRRATIDDVWPIHETARASWHAAYDELLGAETVDDVVDEWYGLGDLESSIVAATGRDDAEFLVVDRTDDPELADCRGFVHAVPWPEDSTVAYVVTLHVSPEAWREGTGTTLLAALEETVGDSFDAVRLAVLADNEIGVSFVESASFERVATRESGLGDELLEYVYEKPL